MSTRVLAIGATGNVGSEVVRQLVAAGETPRVYVRDPAKAKQLLGESGYELVEGQLSDEAGLGKAMAGVEALYMVTFETEEYFTFLDNALGAANDAGVKRMVLMSATSDENSEVPFLRIHGLMERKVKESGLNWTILHPDWFMQNFFGNAGVEEVVFPAGPGKSAFIDVRDIASVAIAALCSDDHAGKILDLTGPESLTYGEAVAKIAEGSGFAFRYVQPTPEQFREGFIAQGNPPEYADLMIDITQPMRDGVVTPPSGVVEQVLGRPPISMVQFAQDYAAVLKG